MFLSLLPRSTGLATRCAHLSRRDKCGGKGKTTPSSWLASKSALVSLSPAFLTTPWSFEFFKFQDTQGTHCPRMLEMRSKDRDQGLFFSTSGLSSKLPPPEQAYHQKTLAEISRAQKMQKLSLVEQHFGNNLTLETDHGIYSKRIGTVVWWDTVKL